MTILHSSAGLLALAAAFYYLFSDALSFGPEIGAAGLRPRFAVCTIFAVAACLLLFTASRRKLVAQKFIGYACIGLGLATLWLMFEGSNIAA